MTFIAIWFLTFGLLTGYHLGWKRGNRAGLRIHIAPTIINVVQSEDSDRADWWKDNDKPDSGL